MAECEKQPSARCKVAAHDGGVQYVLQEMTELSDVRLVYAPPRAVGKDGLRLRLATPRGELDALAWGMAARVAELREDRPIDVAFRLERDEWNGNSRLQARIADFRDAGATPRG